MWSDRPGHHERRSPRDAAAMTGAAGATTANTNMNEQSSIPVENAVAIDRWEDEGGAGESAATTNATRRSMLNRRAEACLDRRTRPRIPTTMRALPPLTIRRPADS